MSADPSVSWGSLTRRLPAPVCAHACPYSGLNHARCCWLAVLACAMQTMLGPRLKLLLHAGVCTLVDVTEEVCVPVCTHA